MDKFFQLTPAYLIRLDELMDGHTGKSLERSIVIRTPENLEVSYELAGAGTRVTAYLIDASLMVLAISILQNLLMAVLIPFSQEYQVYVLAILGVLSFAYFNAYFIVFELVWAGQTPGKRMVGIRVVKTGGYALRFPDSLIRNLLRAIDFLPLCYGVGLCSLLLSRHCQRIGDLVAGTLVVYQAKESSEPIFASNPAPDPASQFSVVQLGAVPVDVLEICDEFLRVKEQLAPKYRQQFAGNLLDLIERLSGLFPSHNQSAEAFFLSLVSQAGHIVEAT